MLKDDRFGTNYFVELEIIVNFASTVPTTPLNDAYHGGTSVFYICATTSNPQISWLRQHCLRSVECSSPMIARSHEEFVIEHYNKYDSPDCPPSWKTMEVASFGTLSKLFSNLANTDIKKVISRSFQLPSYVFLENWMKCAAVLRNCCAHHARLWNRRFSVIPKYPANLQGEWIVTPLRRPEKLYGQLCYLAYMEQSIHPNSQLKRSLINIMSNIRK